MQMRAAWWTSWAVLIYYTVTAVIRKEEHKAFQEPERHRKSYFMTNKNILKTNSIKNAPQLWTQFISFLKMYNSKMKKEYF